MHHVAGEDEAGVAKHDREEPHDARDAGFVGELRHEAGEVDLGLLARRRLETGLKGLRPTIRPNGGNEPLHRRIGASVSPLADLAVEPDGAEIRERGHPLAQIVQIGRQLARSARLTGPIGRRLQAARDVLPDGLRVTTRLPGDGADRQPLTMQIQDHDEFSKLDHPRRPHPNQSDGNGRSRRKA